uniref:Uncharacterized protein n=1 Tax=Anguilla anguilla TaxID=7936 RepID=A0A0E9RAH8_ANGAN
MHPNTLKYIPVSIHTHRDRLVNTH